MQYIISYKCHHTDIKAEGNTIVEAKSILAAIEVWKGMDLAKPLERYLTEISVAQRVPPALKHTREAAWEDK